jgi:hypothetical protein
MIYCDIIDRALRLCKPDSSGPRFAFPARKTAEKQAIIAKNVLAPPDAFINEISTYLLDVPIYNHEVSWA